MDLDFNLEEINLDGGSNGTSTNLLDPPTFELKPLDLSLNNPTIASSTSISEEEISPKTVNVELVPEKSPDLDYLIKSSIDPPKKTNPENTNPENTNIQNNQTQPLDLDGMLKTKLENEKNKAIKPEPNPETGEVPLTIGLAHKLLRDKEKKEVKSNAF